jgi:threonine synthase
VDEAEASACIASVYRESGRVLDPHTAVAYVAAKRHDPPPDAPTVVVATAHPAKFPETVEAAIGREVPLPESLRSTTDAPERMTAVEPTDAALARVLRGASS